MTKGSSKATRWLPTGRSWLLCVSSAALAAAPIAQASAAYWSEVSIAGTGITAATEGGNGVGSADLTDSGVINHADYDQTASAHAAAASSGGTLRVDLEAGGDVAAGAPSGRSSGAAAGSGFFSDGFAIGPGSSGLPDGEPVQVELEVRLSGVLDLKGTPSSGTFAEFDVDVTGVPGCGRRRRTRSRPGTPRSP